LLGILKVKPLLVGVIDAIDNWVNEDQREAARNPNSNESARLFKEPLDGKIGMSFALQWRYNFAKLFGKTPVDANEICGIPDILDPNLEDSPDLWSI
jgi:hypothetical protein